MPFSSGRQKLERGNRRARCRRPSRRTVCHFSLIVLPQLCAAYHQPRPTSLARQHMLLEASTSQSYPDRSQDKRFVSPLLEEGYPPVVKESESGTIADKPLLVYLPGFDGTWLAPFLQLPELSTTFDVRCLTMSMEDRSTYDELKADVIDYIQGQVDRSGDVSEGDSSRNFFANIRRPPKPRSRTVYLAGESFGGILASDVALTLLEESKQLNVDIRGLTLINAATCFDRSKLASLGPQITELPRLLYPFGLLRLLPLFTDEYSLPQLSLMVRSQALPSVIDSTQREAYMGRVALSLPIKLKYLPQATLEWRLTEWLETGCDSMGSKMERFSKHPSLRTLIIAGEKDVCLPSISEAERLSSIFIQSNVHVVEDAGHASTCGSRMDLAALMRKRFPELKGRSAMKKAAAQGTGVNLGMEPRYDGRDDVGLSPLKYWSKSNYMKYRKAPE